MKKFFNLLRPKPKSSVALKRSAAAAPASNLLVSLMNELPIDNTWLDYAEMDRITRDATVLSSYGSRKAATLKKELIVECSNIALKEAIESTFNYKTLRKVLDAPMQGCAIFELNWQDDTNILRANLMERDYRYFTMHNGVLKFNPYGLPQEIPEYKVVYSTYEEKFNRPMGTPLAEALFWSVKFKNASLEFWVKFLEKYGSPWAIGKTEGDKDVMADELYAMLGGDSAVIDMEDEVEIHQIQRSGDFDKITEYCDNQIRQVILGGNLTSQVNGGSHAAASVHNDIREDIALSDENLAIDLIKQVVTYTKELNHINDKVLITLKDKDDPNIGLSERDKRISEMGWKPTKEYIEKTYNIEVDTATTPIANSSSPIAFSASKPLDAIDKASSDVNLSSIAIAMSQQVIEIVDAATSYEEALDTLHDAYPKMNLDELQSFMEQSIANAEILGQAEVEYENEQD
jgi:phage gp29-like protein